jgi:hypothetical protein
MDDDTEQKSIMAQFDIAQAKEVLNNLGERLEKLRLLGKLNAKESKEIAKIMKTLSDKIDEAGKR